MRAWKCLLAAVAAATVIGPTEALPSQGSPAAPQRQLSRDAPFEDFSKGFPNGFDSGLPTSEFGGNFAESRTINRRMGVGEAIDTILSAPYEGPVPTSIDTLFLRNTLNRLTRQSSSSVNFSPFGGPRLVPTNPQVPDHHSSEDSFTAEPRYPTLSLESPVKLTHPQDTQSSLPSSSNLHPTFSQSSKPHQGFASLQPSQRTSEEPLDFSFSSKPGAFFESTRIRSKRDVSPRQGVASQLESLLSVPYQGNFPQNLASLFGRNDRKTRNPEAPPSAEIKNGFSTPRNPAPSSPFQFPFELPNLFAPNGKSPVPTMTEARQTLASTFDNLMKTPYQSIIPETIDNLFNRNNRFVSKAQSKHHPALEGSVAPSPSLSTQTGSPPKSQDAEAIAFEPKEYSSGGTERPILVPQWVPLSPFTLQIHPLEDLEEPETQDEGYSDRSSEGRSKRDLDSVNRQSLEKPLGAEEETNDFGNIQEGFWQRLNLDSFFGEPSSIFSRKDPVFSDDAAAEEHPTNKGSAESVRPVHRPKKTQITSAKRNSLMRLPVIQLPDLTTLRRIPSFLAKPFQTGPSFRSLNSMVNSDRVPRHIVAQNRRLPKATRQQDIPIQRRSFAPQHTAQQRQFDHAFFQETGAGDPASKGFIVGQPDSFPSFFSIGGFRPMQDHPETTNFVEEFEIPSVPIPGLPDTSQQEFASQVRSSRVHRTAEESPAGSVSEISQLPPHHRVPRQLESFAVFNFPRFTTGGEAARPFEDHGSSLADTLSAHFDSRSIGRVVMPRGLTSDDIVVSQSQRYFPSLGPRRPVALSPPHRFFPPAPVPPSPPVPRDLVRFKPHAPGFRDFHETFYGTRNHESIHRPKGSLPHSLHHPVHKPRDFPPVDNSLLGSGNFEVLSGGTFYDEDDLHKNHHFDHYLDNTYVAFPNEDIPYTNNHVDDFFSNFRDFSEFAVRRSGTSNSPDEKPNVFVDAFASEVVPKTVKPEGVGLPKAGKKDKENDKDEGKKNVDKNSDGDKISNIDQNSDVDKISNVDKTSNVDIVMDSKTHEDPTSPSVTETHSEEADLEGDLASSSSSISTYTHTTHRQPKNIQEVLEEIEHEPSALQDSSLNVEEEVDPMMATF